MTDGSPSAPLLIVGMSPGHEEMEAGRPFVGASGRLLWTFLSEKAGIGRDDCYIVNTIGELPGGKGGKTITPAQTAKYWSAFDNLVSQWTGTTALILGGEALQRFAGLKGIEAWRGYIVTPKELPEEWIVKRPVEVERKGNKRCKCVERVELLPPQKPKYAYVIMGGPDCPTCAGTGWAARKGDKRTEMRSFVETPPGRTLPGLRWLLPTLHPAAIIRSGFSLTPVFASDLARVGRALRGELYIPRFEFTDYPLPLAGGPVAVDIETGGGGEIVRIGLADDRRTWSAAWGTQALAAAREVLGDGRTVIMHNAGFDEPRLRAAGCPITGPIFDTMLAAYQIQPDGRKGLNWVASLLLDIQRWKHLSGSQPELYNALDVRHTWDLYPLLVAELERTGQRKWFEGTMMPGLRILIHLSEVGLRIDMDYLPKWLDNLDQQELRQRARWSDLAPGVNPNSPIQVCRFLGIPSSDEDTLTEWIAKGMDENGAARTLLEIRAIKAGRKLAQDNVIRGCINPNYLPGAKDDDAGNKGIAYSGRPTARDPNVQQFPPHTKRLVIPHQSGNLLIEADWNQIELRITAALSGDKTLAQDLEGDLHQAVATELMTPRKLAKVVVYLSAYLGSPRTLQKKLRTAGYTVSFADCKGFQDRLFRRYQGWSAWRNAVIAEAAHKCELTNPFGKWAPFMRGKGDASRAVNFNPQSGAACILWSVLPALEGALSESSGQFLTVVHDSALGEAPRDKINKAAEAMKDTMEREWPQIAPGFKVPVEVKVGKNWGKMEGLWKTTGLVGKT